MRSLRTKLILGYASLIALIIMLSCWAIANFLALSRTPGDITFENYRSIEAANNMRTALRSQEVALLSMAGSDDQVQLELLTAAQSDFTQWFTRASDNITVPGEKEAIDALRNAYAAFTSQVESARQAALTGDVWSREQLDGSMAEVDAALAQLKKLNEDSMRAYDRQALTAARRATYSMAFLSGITIVLGVAWSFVVVGGIIKPINKLTEGVRRITSGDRGYRIEVGSQDEVGELAKEFTTMSEKLAEYDEENIKQLMAARSRAEAAVQSIEDPIILINRDFTVYSMNHAAEQLFGVSEHDTTGRHFLESINKPEVFARIKKVMEEANPTWPEAAPDEQVMLAEVSGVNRYYSLKVTPVGNGEHKVGVLALFQDVTKFEEINQMKSDFVSTVSHEFRTPLTSIMMGVGLVLEEEVHRLSEPAQTMIRIAMDEAKRLNSLVSELLDLSRIESGRIEMEIDEANVAGMIDTAARPLIPQMEEKGIKYLRDLPEDFPKVKADANKIAWVLSNLLSNAMRYTPSGGCITFSAERRGNKAILSVKDTGTGIPKNYVGRIFDKFVQVTGHGQAGGAGLGLAISKEIVVAHGGRIWVESVEGVGSQFFFTLNLAVGEESTNEQNTDR
jgi:PAS domain S-box-containing protein